MCVRNTISWKNMAAKGKEGRREGGKEGRREGGKEGRREGGKERY